MKEIQLVQPEVSESFKSILESIDDAVIIFDDCQNCLFCNPAAERLFNLSGCGCSQERMRSLEFYQSEIAIPFTVRELPSIPALQEVNKLEVFVRHADVPDGRWIEVTRKPFENGVQKGSVIVCRDITRNKQVEAQILHHTFHDQLTGLPNRNLLLNRMDQAIAVTQEQKDYLFAVLFVDLDRFKAINNSLGRKLGDQLLIAIARRLEACLRSKDTIARLGSDEFGILLENIQSTDGAIVIAERIYQELKQSIHLDGHEIFANASIGIALSTSGYSRPEDLLRDADLAMTHAKRQSRAHYQIFNQDMQVQEVKLLKLENDLQRAIERQELQLYYQPIVCLKTKKIGGFEALVRWQHPTRGFTSPAEFIPVAEETGLIAPLGTWVLREACRQMRAWQRQFAPIFDWKISVNVSGKQLAQGNFVAQVKQILQETDFNPYCLKLEITESSLVDNPQAAIAKLKHLQALGIEFSLDDFGTGYSSLSNLHQFPFNTLKIDRSFINSMDSGEKLGIVRAIVSLARNLGLDVVAEGIETANQLAQLKVLKCQYGQGYFFSKPIDNKTVEALIARQLIDEDRDEPENPKMILEEQLVKEQLLYHIENLRQELEDLKLEKTDLEIMLETTTEHADLVESELQKEISYRQETEAALHQVNQELERLTILDSLTQIANRRRFDDYLQQEWQHLRQKNAPISLILCDVDYFKLYNDTYGHQVGDRCLQQVALAIRHALEGVPGLVARYGGEEFAAIVPNADAQKAMQVAETIRQKIESLEIPHHRSSVSEYVTLSLGVFSMVPPQEGSPELLIEFADKALYKAKERGRDRAIFALS